MRIRKIKLNNFRQFYGEQVLEFAGSRLGQPNVTVIYGENGRGKTTIYRAVLFCLFGKKFLNADQSTARGEDDLGLVNRIALDNDAANGGNSVRCSVELEFEDEGRIFTLSRSIRGILSEGRLFEEEEPPTLLILKPDGNTDTLHDSDAISDQIDEIIDRRVAHYFLFDGERIERLTQTQEAQRREVRHGIQNILKLDVLDKTIGGLKAAEKHLFDELGKHSTGEALQKQKEVADARNRMAEMEKRIGEEHQNLEATNMALYELESSLEQYDQIQDQYAEIKGLRSDIERMELNRRKTLAELRDLNTSAALMYSSDLLGKLRSRIDNLGYTELNLPRAARKKLVDMILAESMCICNRLIDHESPEARSLKDWVDSGGESISTINRLSEGLVSAIRGANEKQKIARDKIKEYARDIEILDGAKESLRKKEEELGGPNPSSEIESLKTRRQELQLQAAELKASVSTLERDRAQVVAKLDELERQFNNALARNKVAEGLRNQRNLISETMEVLANAKAQFEREVARELESEGTKLLKKFLDSEGRSVIQRLVVQDDWTLEVFDSRDRPILSGVSAGQRQVVSLAFITALARVASGDDQRTSLEMPLFMDTPFGRLSGKHRDHLLQQLPNLTPQWILLATDTEFTSVEATILRESGRWGKVYVLEQREAYKTFLKHVEVPLFHPSR